MTVFSKTYSKIIGTGSYLPEKRVTNQDLTEQLAAKGIELRACPAALDILHKALQAGGRENIRLAMKQVVPTYRDPEEVNCQVQNN